LRFLSFRRSDALRGADESLSNFKQKEAKKSPTTGHRN
jgi:hypothetical protein